MVNYRYMIIKENNQLNRLESRRIAIQKLEDLPTISLVLQKVLEIVNSDKASANDLAKLVSHDQSLMSIILKLVNSAFFGHMRKISSIHQATVILGFNTVKSIALGATLFQPDKSGKGGDSIDRKALWLHSLATAQTSKFLAQIVSYPDPDEAYIGGLLHDLGKVVLDITFPIEFQEAYQHTKKENKPIIDLEQEKIGIDHAEAGYILLNKWQLPVAVAEGIRFHHSPDKAKITSKNLASIINVSNHISAILGFSIGINNTPSELDEGAVECLKLKESHIERIIVEMEEKKDEIVKFGTA